MKRKKGVYSRLCPSCLLTWTPSCASLPPQTRWALPSSLGRRRRRRPGLSHGLESTVEEQHRAEPVLRRAIQF